MSKQELWFAKPDTFNDPFDCQVEHKRILKLALEKAKIGNPDQIKKINDKIDKLLKGIGVCAFSRARKNQLMWSHYADNHRGVCLTYEFPRSFFDETSNEILGIVDVDYGINPLSDWFLQEALKHNSLGEFVRDLIKKALTVKAKLWEYEKEVRILRKQEGVHVIDKKYLKQICFGLLTPIPDITLLKNIILQSGYEVDLCKMVHSTSSDFGFEPIEI